MPNPRTISIASLAAVIADDLTRSISAQIALLVLNRRASEPVATEHLFYSLVPGIAHDIAREIADGSAPDFALPPRIREILQDALKLNRPRGRSQDQGEALALARALGYVLNRAFADRIMPSIAVSLELLWSHSAGMDANRRPAPAAASRWSIEQLSDAIERAFHDIRREDDWLAELTAAYTEIVRLDNKPDLTPDPDSLVDTLSRGVTMFRESLLGQMPNAGSPRWAASLAQRLERHAAPVFARAEPLTAEKATVIRLAALCLAQDADVMGSRETGDLFRHVAAGVTLLQLRASGTQSATEAIMLAVE